MLILLMEIKEVEFDVAFGAQKYFGGLEIPKDNFELLEVSSNIQQAKHDKRQLWLAESGLFYFLLLDCL